MKSIFFFLLLLSQTVFCQDTHTPDSLKNDLAKQHTDTGKIKTLSELSFYFAPRDPALAMKYATDQKAIADKINIPKFTANAMNDLAIIQYYTGKYSDALQNNKAALAIREKLGDKSLMVSSLNKIAVLYQDLGVYDTAADYQFRILKLAEELQNDDFIAKTYGNIGYLYDQMKQPDKSEKYAKLSLDLAGKVDDRGLMARAYSNIGSCFSERKNYDSAVFYYKKGITFFTEDEDLGALASAYNDLGFVYRKKGDNGAGLEAYRKAYDLATSLGMDNDRALYAANMAGVLLEQRRYDEAFKYMLFAKSNGLENNNLHILRTAYGGLSNYYFLQNNVDSGIYYQDLYAGIVDSMFAEKSMKQVAELDTKYQTEKREHEIDLLNKENTIQKLSLSRNKILLGIAAGVLLAGFGFGFLIWNRNKLKQEARLQDEVMKQQELATEAVIEAEENERRRIARDLHDGVGQMMSAAKMNLSLLEERIPFGSEEKNSFDKALALVDESCKEVRSVSHNMMPNALIKTGLASAVRTFIEQIESPSLKVQLYTEGLNESINKNTESVLYRVLQECVNNVVKHAKASNLDIALIKDETGINATIEDNGKGFDTSDKNKFTGIGLDNMQKRISFLKGTVEWQSSPGAGTLVAIYVPNNS